MLFVTHNQSSPPAPTTSCASRTERCGTREARRRRSALDSVVKHYTTPAGLVRAVDGITLDVEPGTSLAITGPSGCGKSTLLGLIGGLEAPTAGRVSIGGQEISSTVRARARPPAP